MSRYDFKDGKGLVPAHQHPNGGGWVADDCHIYSSAKIEIGALVYGGSTVGSACIIEGTAVVVSSEVYTSSLVEGTLKSSHIAASSILAGAVLVGGQISDSRVGGSVKNCALIGVDLSSGVTIEDSTLRDSKIEGKGCILKSTLDNVTIMSEVSDIESSTLNECQFSTHVTQISNSKLEHCTASGLVAKIRSTQQTGVLTLEGDTFLSGSVLGGVLKIKGYVNVIESIVSGNWVIVDSRIRMKGTINGTGILENTLVQGGTVKGNLCLQRTEVRDEATLNGKRMTHITNCFFYGKTKVKVDSGSIINSEFFGDSKVDLQGDKSDLYLYAGVSIM